MTRRRERTRPDESGRERTRGQVRTKRGPYVNLYCVSTSTYDVADDFQALQLGLSWSLP